MKDYYLKPNKKKIRGWKRRIKQIKTWGEDIKRPYLNYFTNGGSYTYDRCTLSPFYKLTKRQPPLWFYKLIIDKFIDAYDEWQRLFAELNIPFDLHLQVYDPNFMWSEIICRKVDEQDDTITYECESEIQRPFPYHRFANNESKLKQFNWILGDEEHVIFESELEEEDLNANDLLAENYRLKEGTNGDYYAKKLVIDGSEEKDKSSKH